MKTAVIIPFHNGDEYIEQCIDSVMDQNIKEVIIFVIDNSDKESRLKDRMSARTGIHWIKTQANIGYGRACNVGVYLANQLQPDYILILNQDAILHPDMLVHMVKGIEGKEKALIIPFIFAYDGQTIDGHYIKWILSTCPFLITDILFEKELAEAYQIKNFSGACFMYKAADLSAYGIFDPVFYMYGEDNDLKRVLREANFRFFVSPYARINHFHTLNQTQNNYRVNATRLILKLIHARTIIEKLMGFLIFSLTRIYQFLYLTARFKCNRIGPIIRSDLRHLQNIRFIFSIRNREKRVISFLFKDLDNRYIDQDSKLPKSK